MNDNHWQTGGMEVVTFFTRFFWPSMLFTRGCLQFGQQYPPLNRKQDPCRRERSTRGLSCPDDTGHRDVTSCEARDFVQFRKWRW